MDSLLLETVSLYIWPFLGLNNSMAACLARRRAGASNRVLSQTTHVV